jgi:nucleotide-binding universal stress UspA family protein
MMRTLLAYDVSPGSEEALTLLLGLDWPAGSAVEVVAVAEPVAVFAPVAPLAPPDLATSQEVTDEIVGYLEGEVDRVVERLRSAGIEASGTVTRGRPGSVLLEAARQLDANLIVAGSRGHGAIATLVLGSVSAELVDHAPCPVLIARQPSASRVLFATDGSPSAARAESMLATWPILRGRPVRVVSVAEVVRPWHSGIAPTMHRLALDAYAKDVEAATAQHQAVAQAAVERLRAAGADASAAVPIGDAAAEIVDEATRWGADLIVLGSRGLTGVSRILLGSVARNVLQASTTSILVVREPGNADGASRA